MGHSQAVKDVAFNRSGERFLSASFDRQIKMWDTETGKCTFAFSNGKIPNVVKFHPDADKQNIFMAGMQDKKIIQVSRYTLYGDPSTTRDSGRLCKHTINILGR
jgi:pre-mRNA-processing factor 17